jgi:hypothetical protein
VTTKTETPTKKDPVSLEEFKLLKNLERAERRLRGLNAAKADDVAEHNEGIKTGKEDRDHALKSLDDFRNGIQKLPLE